MHLLQKMCRNIIWHQTNHQTSAFGKPFLAFFVIHGSPQQRCQVMTETLKGTANETGFEMAMASPLLEHFAAAYDGQHPLLDAGPMGNQRGTKGGDGEDSKYQQIFSSIYLYLPSGNLT